MNRRSSGDDLPTLAGSPPVLGPEEALRCLISGAIPQGQLPSLIETVFSDEKATDMVGCLRGSDVQAFIDAIYNVCYVLPSPRNELFDLGSNLTHLDRPWRASTLRQGSEGKL